MSEKYGVDLPWHLTQDPDTEPSYEELAARIEEIERLLKQERKAHEKEVYVWQENYAALEAENARLREALGWASVVVDSVKDCEEVDPNTLAAAIIKMDALQEGEQKEPFSEYGHYGENNPPVGMSSPGDKDYEV